jgi:hypothetical protein
MEGQLIRSPAFVFPMLLNKFVLALRQFIYLAALQASLL